MLGGPRAFSEGGYAGTAVADVAAGGPRSRSTRQPKTGGRGWRCGRPAPAAATRGHADGRDRGRPRRNAGTTLPELTDGEPRRRRSSPARPCCSPAPTSRGASGPVLVFQRYGRGKAFAFTPQDSWLWQMHASIAVEDHDARELLASAAALAGRRRARSGRAASLDRSGRAGRARSRSRAEVVDPSFVELNDARVTATVTGPDGSDRRRADAVERRARRRVHRHAPDQRRRAGTRRGSRRRARGSPLGSCRRRTSAPAPGDAEFFDATLQAATLRRIAEDTGGTVLHAGARQRARRGPALHRPRRHHGGGARAVAHADRADAAARPALRGMGVPACRRPLVTRWRLAGCAGRRRSRSWPWRWPRSGWLRRRRTGGDAAGDATEPGRVRRPLRVRAAALQLAGGSGGRRFARASRRGRTTTRAPIATS